MGSPDEDQQVIEIQEAFAATGWKQDELARRSGVAVRTLRRVLAGSGNPDRRTIVKLRRALDLPIEGAPPPPADPRDLVQELRHALNLLIEGTTPPDPRDVVQQLSTIDFIAEAARRLYAADMILEQERIRLGELPPDIADRPGVIRGPDTGNRHTGSEDN